MVPLAATTPYSIGRRVLNSDTSGRPTAVRPDSLTPRTRAMCVYDLRINQHFTLKSNPLKRSDLDEFVALYRPDDRAGRQPTWSEWNPSSRWRCYAYDDLIRRA